MKKRKETLLLFWNNISAVGFLSVATGFFVFGFFIGLLVSYISSIDFNQYYILINREINILSELQERFFTHGLGLIFLFLAGLTKWYWLVFFPLIWIGASIGFVGSFMLSSFGAIGIWYSFLIFGIQSIILLFIYFFIIYNVFKYKTDVNLLEYFLSIFICLIGVGLISVYEVLLLSQVLGWVF